MRAALFGSLMQLKMASKISLCSESMLSYCKTQTGHVTNQLVKDDSKYVISNRIAHNLHSVLVCCARDGNNIDIRDHCRSRSNEEDEYTQSAAINVKCQVVWYFVSILGMHKASSSSKFNTNRLQRNPTQLYK